MSDSMLRRLGSLADQAEVFERRTDAAEARFANAAVKTAAARESSGVAVRAIRNGRMGFAGSRDTSPEGIEKLLANVQSSIEVGDRTGVTFPGPAPMPSSEAALGCHDAATEDLGIEDLVAAGQELLGKLRDRHPGVVFDATLRRRRGSVRLSNTAGTDIGHRNTTFSISIEANRTRDEDVLMDYVYAAGRARAAADDVAAVESLSRRLSWAERDASIRPGRLPVLFSPAGSLVVWSPLFQALSGKTVMVGTSPLRDKLGRVVLDSKVSLTDEGLLPGGLGSSPFDDEGLTRRRTPLVEAGVLRSFLHDLETAEATGQEPTGNGERGGLMGAPHPGFSNVVIGGGQRGFEEILGGIEYGLLVHSVMGMGQGNTLPGNFSNPVDLAYLIEDGEVKGRVKDVSIAGNIYEILGPEHLDEVSRDLEVVYGAYHLPWLRIDGMNVVGKGSTAG